MRLKLSTIALAVSLCNFGGFSQNLAALPIDNFGSGGSYYDLTADSQASVVSKASTIATAPGGTRSAQMQLKGGESAQLSVSQQNGLSLKSFPGVSLEARLVWDGDNTPENISRFSQPINLLPNGEDTVRVKIRSFQYDSRIDTPVAVSITVYGEQSLPAVSSLALTKSYQEQDIYFPLESFGADRDLLRNASALVLSIAAASNFGVDLSITGVDTCSTTNSLVSCSRPHLAPAPTSAVSGKAVLTGGAALASSSSTIASPTATPKFKCTDQVQCKSRVCPAIPGGDNPRCDLATGVCYCGGACGDGYCDYAESRNRSCVLDCNRCNDGTLYGQCSTAAPLFCAQGVLKNQCDRCPCPAGKVCQIDGLCALACSDGTLYGNCSIKQPLACNFGALEPKCQSCGCPAGQECLPDGNCKLPPPPEAFFEFTVSYFPETFVIRLVDPVAILQARRIVSGEEKRFVHVMGTLAKGARSYNSPWLFHLQSESISFFEYSAEECDANIAYVKQNFDSMCGPARPSCRWCPWGSNIKREILR